MVREIAPRVPVVARTHFLLEVDPLYAAGATAVVAEEFESTLEVLALTLRIFGISDSAIARFGDELREEGYEPLRTPELALDPWLGEILEDASAQWIEIDSDLGPTATLEGLAVRARTGCSVLAIERQGERTLNPPSDHVLVKSDRLLVFGTPAAVERLQALLGQHAEGSP